ncbi:MAG: hypothetical protein MRY83_02265 [Flavobacteriales bacterium]|nr:hypothetical protein [Flavobacteriales bacterium]
MKLKSLLPTILLMTFTLQSFAMTEPQKSRKKVTDSDKRSEARVNKINDFYVFTDSKPKAKYEELTTIRANISNDDDVIASLGNYHSIRDALIRRAKEKTDGANGIIMNIGLGSIGTATIIKIDEGSSNKDLATVNKISGYYIFTDAEPLEKYDKIGSVQSIVNATGSGYVSLRDKFITKSRRKVPGGDAIMMNFDTGAADAGDVIKFQ